MEQALGNIRACSNVDILEASISPKHATNKQEFVMETHSDFEKWLSDSNLCELHETFVSNGFDSFATVKLITEVDLQEMAVDLSLHRKVFQAVSALQRGVTPDFAHVYSRPQQPPVKKHLYSASESSYSQEASDSSSARFFRSSAPIVCRFFQGGFCNRGDTCYFSHELNRIPPVVLPLPATPNVFGVQQPNANAQCHILLIKYFILNDLFKLYFFYAAL